MFYSESFTGIFLQMESFFGNIWVQMVLLVLIATFHGYGAAWLAVRMLFRPRQPFKVFGVTLFPQGMIPRHRDRLANAIGKAVGDELVSQETIMEELLGKDFLRRKIRGVVDSYTEELLAQNYPSLIDSLPRSLREPVLDAVASLQLMVASHVEDVLKSEESVGVVRAFVERRVDEVLSQRVSDILDEKAFAQLAAFFEERFRFAVNSGELENKIGEFIGSRIDDLANTPTQLGEMFTPEAIKLLKEKAGEQISPIAHHLSEIAAAERTRNQIATLIKREVHDYYEGLPFFKKIFVSRENLLSEVDDLVNESLPKRIEETLKGDFFAEEARSFIDSSIEGALSRPLPELIGTISPQQRHSLKDQITHSVLTLLRGDEMMNHVSVYISDTIEHFRPHSIDSIMRAVHPESEAKLKKMLANGLHGIIAREDTSKMINDMLARQIDVLLSAPIGRLSDHFPEKKLRLASESVADVIIAAIREKLPEAIKEFDVGGIVREKIKNYPAEKLEALVLSVAREHLRTIELFGALFGFIIGLLQAIQFYFYAG